MITFRNDDGSWGMHGYDVRSIPGGLYGAAFKLMEYESTGLEPQDVKWMDELYRQKCEEVAKLKKENDKLKNILSAYTSVETPASKDAKETICAT